MSDQVEETRLPGVGVRYAFDTTGGVRITVLHHHSGRHQVFVGDRSDPDMAQEVLELDDADSRILAELLGASRVVREIDRLQQSVAGLSIDWLPITAAARANGRTIGELEIRSRTGVTVVAVMRGGEALPGPGPDFTIHPDDTVVVMGRPDSIRRANALLRG